MAILRNLLMTSLLNMFSSKSLNLLIVILNIGFKIFVSDSIIKFTYSTASDRACSCCVSYKKQFNLISIGILTFRFRDRESRSNLATPRKQFRSRSWGSEFFCGCRVRCCRQRCRRRRRRRRRRRHRILFESEFKLEPGIKRLTSDLKIADDDDVLGRQHQVHQGHLGVQVQEDRRCHP